MLLAEALVHTNGINWESVGVISGAMVAAMTLLVTLQERRTKAVRTEIKEAVDHLGDVLTEKLETKVAVAALAERMARMEGRAGLPRDPSHSGG